jgi:hypothetical protein
MLFARRSTCAWLGTFLTGSHFSLSASFIDHSVLSLIRECGMFTFVEGLEL